MTFSVVIPTFNRRHTLAGALDSALSQAVKGLEVIVVDDRSSDGTVEWVRDAYSHQPVRVLVNDRSKGPAGARNTGLLAARGDLIAFLDSDDLFLSGHLAECAKVFERFSEVGVVFGRARYEQEGRAVEYMGPNFERKLALAPKAYVDDMVSVFDDSFFDHLLRYGCWFNLSTVVFRAADKDLMREELRVAEDYEYWARLSRTRRFACLHQPQVRYALHDSNVSFETAGSAADHAPSQLAAYKMILDYGGLQRYQARILEEQMARVLFDWAYRCRARGEWREAADLHVRSFRLGMRRLNAVGLVKLGMFAAFPWLARRRRPAIPPSRA